MLLGHASNSGMSWSIQIHSDNEYGRDIPGSMFDVISF